MKFCAFIFILVVAVNAEAQSGKPDGAQPAAPVTVKRVPPQQQQAPRSATVPAQPANAQTRSVLSDFRPKPDMPLTPTAEAAVHLSEKWLTETSTPTPGKDGRVVYSYGSGLPTVVCAPLRVCMVELQAGERLVGEPHIGDSVRWNIAPALFGKGDTSTTVIVIKPQ